MPLQGAKCSVNTVIISLVSPESNFWKKVLNFLVVTPLKRPVCLAVGWESTMLKWLQESSVWLASHPPYESRVVVSGKKARTAATDG
jgi:hypothetical protein